MQVQQRIVQFILVFAFKLSHGALVLQLVGLQLTTQHFDLSSVVYDFFLKPFDNGFLLL